jgi:hypothetical protein
MILFALYLDAPSLVEAFASARDKNTLTHNFKEEWLLFFTIIRHLYMLLTNFQCAQAN